VDRIDYLSQRLSLSGSSPARVRRAARPAVSVWPTSVVQLGAMRRRSASWAASARWALVAPLGLDPVEHRVEGARTRVIISVLILSPIANRRRAGPGASGRCGPSGSPGGAGGQTTVSSSRLTARSSAATDEHHQLADFDRVETVAGLAIRMNTASPKTIRIDGKTLHRIETKRAYSTRSGCRAAIHVA